MPVEPEARPNIIVVFTDQQRWDTLGVAGNPCGLTPNLDRMAERGRMFETACAANPVCAPSRAAILTGQYPTTVGVHRNGMSLPPGAPTIGSLFQEAGYYTGYIGKWHLSDDEPVPPSERQGFDYWLASNLLEFTSDAYRTVLFDGEGEAVSLPGYRTDAIVDASIRFLADNVDTPFMLFTSLLEPHHQNELDSYPAPEVYRRSYEGAWLPPDLASLGGSAHQHIAGYYGQVKRLDEGLGRIRDALLSLGIERRTIVVYTSDHGSHFKTRNDEYKRSCHDASIRVPFVFDGPGFRGGGRVSRPVSTVDLVPTLLDAAGIEVPDSIEGRSLLAVDDESDAYPPDVFVQVSETETGRALRTERWKFYAASDDPRDQPSADRYVERALYDLEHDPAELDNVIDSAGHRELAGALGRRLTERIQEIEGRFVEIEPFSGALREGRWPETMARRNVINTN